MLEMQYCRSLGLIINAFCQMLFFLFFFTSQLSHPENVYLSDLCSQREERFMRHGLRSKYAEIVLCPTWVKLRTNSLVGWKMKRKNTRTVGINGVQTQSLLIW